MKKDKTWLENFMKDQSGMLENLISIRLKTPKDLHNVNGWNGRYGEYFPFVSAQLTLSIRWEVNVPAYTEDGALYALNIDSSICWNGDTLLKTSLPVNVNVAYYDKDQELERAIRLGLCEQVNEMLENL